MVSADLASLVFQTISRAFGSHSSDVTLAWLVVIEAALLLSLCLPIVPAWLERAKEPVGVPRASGPASVRILGDGAFGFSALCLRRYQPVLRRIVEPRLGPKDELTCEAVLVAEEGDPLNPQAVSVRIAGQRVAYLPPHAVNKFMADAGKSGFERSPIKCRAKVRRSRSPTRLAESIVVNLDLAWPMRLVLD